MDMTHLLSDQTEVDHQITVMVAGAGTGKTIQLFTLVGSKSVVSHIQLHH